MTFPGGPTPPYSNPPIQPQNYKPSRFVIRGVTLGRATVINTNIPMNYVVGQLIRLLIPPTYGCVQLNTVLGYITSIVNPNQVIVQIDSSQNVNEFVDSGGSTKPEIIAVGDINTGIISSTGRSVPSTAVPGSFINIS